MSIEQTTSMFAVSAETLELYRLRGTLASRVLADGARVFDLTAVAAVFRRRGATAAPPAGDSFGRLGSVVLGGGTASDGPSSAKELSKRREPPRLPSPGSQVARAGTGKTEAA